MLSALAVTRNGHTLDTEISIFNVLIVGILFLEMTILKRHLKEIANKS